MSADPIIYCLEHLTDYRQFERLCSDLMVGSGYSGLDPIGGTGDRGRDALQRDNSESGLSIFAYTVRSDWRRKLEHDCERIKDEGHNPARLVFVCTSTLSGHAKDEAASFVSKHYGWALDLYDLERVRILLAGNLRHLVAQHPSIFCPPWFPQRGGLSVAEGADTLIIDHIAADHALATWLARRLTLEGFQTWCYGTAPLAGQNADESVRILVRTRAAQYLPVLSIASVVDRDFMDRCGAAGARDDLLLPCWSSLLDEVLQGTRHARIHPARFDRSWSNGLRDVLARLEGNGVKPKYEADHGRSIALRSYIPESVISSTPERVFANVFRATVPASILICQLDRPLGEDEESALRQTWAFAVANRTTLLAFEEPPASVPICKGQRIPEFAWDCYEEREGKRSIDVVKELVKRSLEVACVKAGLDWCSDRRVFYFPKTDTVQTNVSFKHVDGRETRVAMNGERQYGWGERASTFHYQLGPMFRVGRDEAGLWWVTVRIYVRVTDIHGTPFQLKAIVRRRKAVTRSWWNKEWLARLLGVMQALRTNGTDIQIGSGQRAVTVNSVPLEWNCPVSIDVAVLERSATSTKRWPLYATPTRKNKRGVSLTTKERSMSDSFHLLDEPPLSFGFGQIAEDPRDGLALFGPSESKSSLPENIVIGTVAGIALWRNWAAALNAPAACVDVTRQRAWPPFPGFDVAFGARWPEPIKTYAIDSTKLDESARKADKYERSYSVANLYLEPLSQVQRLDAKPALAICIVPDEVYENCRPRSSVDPEDRSDAPKTGQQRRFLKEALRDRQAGQSRMFDDAEPRFESILQNLEQYGLSPDFRRQLKARMMSFEMPVQIVLESTLSISEQVRRGEPGTNPLSDRLWNFGTAVFYKVGLKPWKTPWAREGVCYVGLAYRQAERKRTACCAAQMFLDSGDGIVFVGEFGPWYSEERKEFHLPPASAEKLLRGTIETYQKQDGRPLNEIFLHARSGIDKAEYEGFLRACPPGVTLVAIRVRQDRHGLRLYRYDAHPNVARRGMHPVQRGILWQRTKRHGLLFTTGFKPRIATYDGWETPVPLAISIQYGDADILQVARDILGLTKLNYNACQLGESHPITVKYSDRVGEILLANPDLPSKDWRHNFKYYA